MSTRDICTRQRCHVHPQETYLLESLLDDESLNYRAALTNWAKFRQTSVNTESSDKPPTRTMKFPVDATVGSALDRVDPGMRVDYVKNIVDYAKAPSCVLTPADLEQCAASILTGKLQSCNVNAMDSRLEELSKIPVLSAATLQLPDGKWTESSGRLVRLADGRIGMVTRYETECSRRGCMDRTFRDLQITVPYNDGWGHKPQALSEIASGTIASYTATCTACPEALQTHQLIFTSWMNGEPEHFVPGDGKGYTCRNLGQEVRSNSGSEQISSSIV
jgi:hypothetical protein